MGSPFTITCELHPEIGLTVLNQLVSLVGGRFRRAIHTLTYFLSVVSHELRSPLAAIENYIQTILDGFAGEITPNKNG